MAEETKKFETWQLSVLAHECGDNGTGYQFDAGVLKNLENLGVSVWVEDRRPQPGDPNAEEWEPESGGAPTAQVMLAPTMSRKQIFQVGLILLDGGGLFSVDTQEKDLTILEDGDALTIVLPTGNETE